MWASLVAQLVKNLPAMQGTSVQFWVRKICWRRERLPTPVFLGFPCGSAGKESACNVGDLGWEDPLQKGKATHSSILALENSMDCIVQGVTESWTRLSNFHFHAHVCAIYLVLADGEQGGPPCLLSGFTAVNTLPNGWDVLFLSYWYLCQSKN